MDAAVKTETFGEEYIVRVYNVPIDYTVNTLEHLLLETCPKLEIKQIIPPSPWDNKVDISWKVLVKNQKSYDLLINQEDIWIKLDNKVHSNRAITFVAGNRYDIPQIPFKEDEQLLLNEHISHTQNK